LEVSSSGAISVMISTTICFTWSSVILKMGNGYN
jgi:hypothetical protein